MSMGFDMTELNSRAEKAIKTYWSTLSRQGASGRDQGSRANVTGGKQMDGFASLIEDILIKQGLDQADIFRNSQLEIPGHFRPEKKWDFLVVHRKTLLLALEFKSQAGPSFGNNFNNRSEEAVGVTHDFNVARREGRFGLTRYQPWIGWLMLLEDDPRSRSSVAVKAPHFPVDSAFVNSSYAGRYEHLLRRLVLEKMVGGACLLLAPRGSTGKFSEPADDLTLKRFVAGMSGHVRGYLESL